MVHEEVVGAEVGVGDEEVKEVKEVRGVAGAEDGVEVRGVVGDEDKDEDEDEDDDKDNGEEEEGGKGKRVVMPRVPRRPGDRGELRAWVKRYAGLELPEKGVCKGHQTPLDYLEYVFFERGGTADTVVWACRGGGKTTIGAVATLLDVLYKRGIVVKILGGSKEQSQRMYASLCGMVEARFRTHVKGRVTTKGFALRNGSRVEILTQSQRAVRGARVQKMRCDEAELFDGEVWKAAQLTTRSLREGELPAGQWRRGRGVKGSAAEREAGPIVARGAVEVFSTLHRSGGLMSELVGEEEAGGTEVRAEAEIGESITVRNGGTEAHVGCGEPLAIEEPTRASAPLVEVGGRRVFRWCVWDVISRCREEERSCDGCKLWTWCGGKARKGAGFLAVEDVLAQQGRTSRQTWENEMLCLRPVPEHAVFGAFGAAHQRAFPGMASEIAVDCRVLACERLIAGIDYGWKRFVCLWIALLRDGAGRRAAWVIDEYVQGERGLEAHLGAIQARRPRAEAYFGDIAGRQHDAHSGETSESALKRAGLNVKSRSMSIAEGIERLRQLIEPPETHGRENLPRLWVDPRCRQMIAALTQYEQKGGDPIKDGTHDHLIDALRYALVGHDRQTGKTEGRSY